MPEICMQIIQLLKQMLLKIFDWQPTSYQKDIERLLKPTFIQPVVHKENFILSKNNNSLSFLSQHICAKIHSLMHITQNKRIDIN